MSALGVAVEIPLSRGMVALVDEADANLVRQYRWNAQHPGDLWYARRSITVAGKTTVQYMHRLLLGGSMVDHINGNGLDNRRANLRSVSCMENQRNRRKRFGTSQYKGVYWSEERHRWRTHIRVAGTSIYLGQYAEEVDAACAYDAAARRYFGEHAALNFPLPGERPALHDRS